MPFTIGLFPALMIAVGAIGSVCSSIAVTVLAIRRNRE